MEILGLFFVVLVGSIVGSGVAMWRETRAKPKVETDPHIDDRYDRIATELNSANLELD
ncbi:MAG: hypothetical protein ACR2OY_02485 [Boseongicola sp.]